MEYQSYDELYWDFIRKGIEKKNGDYPVSGILYSTGPTGNGKTFGTFNKKNGVNLIDKITHAGLKSIFITHRHNILTDVVNSIKKNGNQYVFMYSTSDTVRSAISETILANDPNGFTPPSLDSFIDELLHKKPDWWLIEDRVDKFLNLVKESRSQAADSKRFRDMGQYKMAKRIDAEFEINAGIITNTLIRNAIALDVLCEKDEENKKNLKIREKFRKNLWIRRVLPGIAWHDDNIQILIMTTSKISKSFYDGVRKNSIIQKNLRDHVIFIDEFDFQEEEILNSMINNQSIREPLSCLNQLATTGQDAILSRNIIKSKKIKESMLKIIDESKKLFEEIDVDFPNHKPLCVMPDKPIGKNLNILKNHIVHHAEGFRIIREEIGPCVINGSDVKDNKKSMSVISLINKVDYLIMKLKTSISKMESDQRKAFLRACFDTNNDGEVSRITKILNTESSYVSFYDKEQLDFVQSGIPYVAQKMFGHSNYFLHHKSDGFDDYKLGFEVFGMNATPESVIISLAFRNLVIGLSATSEIDRVFENFDTKFISDVLRWSRDHWNPESPYSPPIIGNEEMSVEVEQCVKNSMSLKNKKRNTQYTNEIYDLSSVNDPDVEEMWIDAFEVVKGHIHNRESGYDHKKDRLFAQINSIHAFSKDDHQSAISFSITFAPLQNLIKSDNLSGYMNRFGIYTLQRNEYSDYLSEIQGLGLKSIYPIECNSKPILLVFFNAELSKTDNFMDKYNEIYRISFKYGVKVMIVTQHKSTSNGINLDYCFIDEHGNEIKSDITSIYFIDNHHHFFSLNDSSSESETSYSDILVEKTKMLHRLCYLHMYGEIDSSSLSNHSTTINHLGNFETKEEELISINGLYKKTDDFNRTVASYFIQQLGRINRSWSPVKNIKIVIDSDVAKILFDFSQRWIGFESYKKNMSEIADITFNFISERFEKKMRNYKIKALKQSLKNKPQPPEKADQAIDDLLKSIKKSRSKNDIAFTKKIASKWSNLRQAVLRHDYTHKIDTEDLNDNLIKTVGETLSFDIPSDFNGESLYYNPHSHIFLANKDQGSIRYRIDDYYDVIRQNEIICKYFYAKDFRTSALCSTGIEQRKMLHPTVTQRILSGAIGEESIRALLYDYNIKTDDFPVDPRILELYDFSIKGRDDIYIDAKMWSEHTKRIAEINYKEGEKSNFDNLQSHLNKIRELVNPKAKLLVINLITNNKNCTPNFKKIDMSPATNFDDADIVFLDGCIVEDQPNTLTLGFKQLFQYGGLLDQYNGDK